jgi:SAM-dependent methyltransferase
VRKAHEPVPIDIVNQKPNFDRVARIYRWAEYAALGPLLQRARTHFLPQLEDRHHALVLGDGDGRFLAALLRANPNLHATAVDFSAEMLTLLRQRCAFAADRLTTLHADILTFTPSTPADLIVTHFVLDCFPQPTLDRLTHALAQHTTPHTLWLVSDFGHPRSRVFAPFAALYIRTLYLAFRILTNLRTHQLPDPSRALSLAGFTRTARRDWLNGFLYTELWHRGNLP